MMERSMSQLENTSTRSAALDQNSSLVCVVEMSLKGWLVAGLVPGIERQPLKKLGTDESALHRLLLCWKAEAERAGRPIARIVLAFEAGRDGFWLARWLRARGIEAYVIHPTSVAVSRDHRRPKTDRLDTQMLMRAFLGWLRGEPEHCHMAAIPALEHLDALRTPEGTGLPPNTRAELHRDMARLQFVMEQIQQIEAARGQRLE